MAMVNQMLNLTGTVKDSRWLTLEVCREYQRSKCSRTENECKFAHPPAHVEVQNGRVTACFDSIKGKCQRKEPPCKYLHPPQHLKEQLLQNGRNNLILKNLQMQAVHQATIQPIVPGMVPAVTHPYLGTVPTSAVGFNPYSCMTGVPAMNLPSATESPQVSQPVPGVVPAVHATQQKVTRPDRLENSIPGMVPYAKRMAVTDNKSGIPMYQPAGLASYQQALAAMQLQQQPYIPVTFTGHPPSVPRF